MEVGGTSSSSFDPIYFGDFGSARSRPLRKHWSRFGSTIAPNDDNCNKVPRVSTTCLDWWKGVIAGPIDIPVMNRFIPECDDRRMNEKKWSSEAFEDTNW